MSASETASARIEIEEARANHNRTRISVEQRQNTERDHIIIVQEYGLGASAKFAVLHICI